MNDEKQKFWDIRERSFEYALQAIKLFELLTTISREIPASQILAQMSLGLTGSPQAF